MFTYIFFHSLFVLYFSVKEVYILFILGYSIDKTVHPDKVVNVLKALVGYGDLLNEGAFKNQSSSFLSFFFKICFVSIPPGNIKSPFVFKFG